MNFACIIDGDSYNNNIYIIFQITNIGITVQCTYRDMRNNVKSTIPGIDHKNKNILFEQTKKRYFQS